MIKPDQKDVFLRYLIENIKAGEMWFLSRRETILGFDKLEIFAMLTQFHELRLVHIDNLSSTSRFYRILMRVDAHDFILEGGFWGRYELFQKNVEKLLQEVEKLEKIEGPQKNVVTDIRKKINEYLGLIGNVATIGISIKDITRPDNP